MKVSFCRASVPILVFTITFGAQQLGACVNTFSRTNANGDLIRLDGNMISDSQMNAAANYWQSCAGYGTGFASFTTADVSTPVTVTVIYHGGHNQVCGQATHDTPTSIRIDLWDTGVTTSGQTFSCNVTDTLAHELGHVLNLDNSTCTGYIMGPHSTSWQNGQIVAGTRSVATGECSAASGGWSTSSDGGGGAGGGGAGNPCV